MMCLPATAGVTQPRGPHRLFGAVENYGRESA